MSTSNSLRRFGFFPCRFLLATFLLGAFASAFGQSAPNISYTTPRILGTNGASYTLTPTNTGGTIPAQTYANVSAFAGSTRGSSDNNTGSSAQFNRPVGLALNPTTGDIYVADTWNHRIRKITSAGEVSTIAGSGTAGSSNNTTGTSATFNYPTDLAFDPDQNCLYVADKVNHVIRKVSLTGTFAVTTFAGRAGSAGYVNNSTATSAKFNEPEGVFVVNNSGTATDYLYVADRSNHMIRVVDINGSTGAAGQVSIFAGTSGTDFWGTPVGLSGSTEGTKVGTAKFSSPVQVAVSSDGNTVYVTDLGNHKVRSINGGTVATLAGSGVAGWADGVTGASAKFNQPYGIEFDGAGHLLVSEMDGDRIRRVTTGGVVTTLAGSTTDNPTGAFTNAVGTAARFNQVQGMVLNAGQNILYVCDYENDRVRKIEMGGYAVSPTLPTGLTLTSSTGVISGSPSGSTAPATDYTVTAFNYQGSSATTLNLTIVDFPSLTTTPVTSVTTTTASSGGSITSEGGSPVTARGVVYGTSSGPTVAGSKTTDGSGTGSFTSSVTGLTPNTMYYLRAYATTAAGTAYGTEVSFTTTAVVPSISFPSASYSWSVGSAITPVAVVNTGGGPDPVQVSTMSLSSAIANPSRLAVDGSGNLYLPDYNAHVIKKIDLSTGQVSTLAGSSGVSGNSNGTGAGARFNKPSGIAVNSSGDLYVVDQGNRQIRQVTPAGVVTTLAGSGSSGYTNGQGTSALFDTPYDVVLDGSGNLYVTERTTGLGGNIRKITPGGFVSAILAGTYEVANGSASLAIDNTGAFYFPFSNTTIYRCQSPFSTVDWWIGTDGAAMFADDRPNGVGSGWFAQIGGMVWDNRGNLYVADAGGNNRIRKVSTAGSVSTIAGNGSNAVVDGVGTGASFNNPLDVDIDGSGNMYVAELAAIRIIAPYRISPALPAGLFFDARTGTIRGTPTAASTATTYTVYAQNSGGAVTTTLSLSVSGTATWNGSVSTDWNTAANWTPSGVPTSTSQVIIPTGITNAPAFPATASFAQLTVQSGTTLALGSGILTLTGNLANNGTITASTGKLSLAGSTAQTISGTGTIGSLEINNSAGVTITTGVGNMQTITGILMPTAGMLTTNSNLTLKSDASGTARVGALGSGAAISGDVIAERYVKQNANSGGTGRAWRLVSVPVRGTGTLRHFFMNGRNGQDLTQSSVISAETANSGTPIVGHNYATAAAATGAPGGGFDWIGVVNQVSSLRSYVGNASGGTFLSQDVPDLSTTYNSAAQGYMLFARGDRKLTFPSSSSSGATTLRSTGTLKTGDQTVNVATASTSKYTLVGNPYMSVLDLAALHTANPSVIKSSFWIWDANMAGTLKQGGFVNVFKSGSSWVTNTGTYTNPERIESGMAFFVEPETALASATNITISESHKVSAAAAGMAPFGTAPSDDHGRMFIRLERLSGSAQPQIIDGVMADFHTSFRTALGDQSDREKLVNGISRGALWMSRDNKMLSSQGLPWPKTADSSVVPIMMSGVGSQTLVLKVDPQGMRDRYVQAWLKDKVLKRQIEINMNAPTDYDFIGTGSAAWDSTRFELVFIEAGRPSTGVTLEPDAAAEEPSIKLYPNPSKSADVKLSLQAMVPGTYAVQILDMTGRLVTTTTLNHRSVNGEYRILEGRLLSPGTYLIRLSQSGTPVKTLQLIHE